MLAARLYAILSSETAKDVYSSVFAGVLLGAIPFLVVTMPK